MKTSFTLDAKELSGYDVVVCGGGMAGVAAAVSAARNGVRTLLVESGGALGGDFSKGLVNHFLDSEGKGGFAAEILQFLTDGGYTAPRHGPHYDEKGHRLPGKLANLEYLKYALDMACRKAGVDVALYSMAAAVETDNGRITRLLLATEAGCYVVRAPVYIDATGNGLIAGMAGCDFEFGHPETGEPQPSSMMVTVTGLGDCVQQTDSESAKRELKRKVAEDGVTVSADQFFLVHTPMDGLTDLSFSFQYKVPHDDIFGLSRATMRGRDECVEVVDGLRRRVKGFEHADIVRTPSHIGIREGKRIKGVYRVTFDDIVSGARFYDAVCLVRFNIDVHAINPNDNRDHSTGFGTARKKVQAYNVPYRALLPLGCSNLLLAGRCISGDFYAHASYRCACDVVPMGEAAGYAAALCSQEKTDPPQIDGTRVKAYMAGIGYEL